MPINTNTILHYDLETCSRNPNNTQPIEICCVAVDPRNLTIMEDSTFYSLIKPIEDKEQQEKLGISGVEQGALDVNKKTMEELREAPSLESVWDSFCEYCKQFNPKGNPYNAPILSGFNNRNFDDVIINRIAQQYGPWNKEGGYCPLFNKMFNIDLMQMLFPWFESNYELKRWNMDSVCAYLGIEMEGAHSADVDVKRQCMIMCQLLKKTRDFSKIMNWKRK